MGAARVYVVVAGAALVILAALGLVHLFSRGGDGSRSGIQRGATPAESSPQKQPVGNATQELGQERVLTITELKPTRRRLRDGATLVSVQIGVAPVRETKAGEVEIRVFFFDVTRDGELRPTEAEVTYEWLTPFRDWSDPTPKVLEATYLRPRRARAARDRLRYGGFIVRVYSDGKLQDERGEPEQILTKLRDGTPSREAADGTPQLASPRVASEEDEEEESPPPESITAASPREPTPTPGTTTSSAPFGKPAPGKPGFVYSPHDEKFIIDVRGVPPGTEIIDPNTGKPLRVP